MIAAPLKPFGFLPCKKPIGMTSRDLVNHVQRQIRRETGLPRLKAGHTGTLDPLADGVVVVAIGSATRLMPWMLEQPKCYVGTFEFGASSHSGDLEDGCQRHPELPLPTLEAIQSAAKDMKGWIEQTPPAHSAIWIDGKRAHQRVRNGETIDMPSRHVWLESVHVNAYRPPMVQLEVRCGSGTYLRTLGMDLAGQLGTTAVMTSLTRTHVGPFDLNSAMEPETFVTDKPTPNNPEPCLPSNLHRQLINPAFALHHMARLHCDHAQSKQLRNGLLIDGSIEKAEKPLIKASKQPSQDAIAIDEQGQLIAIVRQKNERWAPHRVFMA